MTDETLEIEEQLDKLLTDVQPNLQDVIKRVCFFLILENFVF